MKDEHREKKPDIREYLTDEQKRLMLEKTKALYARLPKEKEAVFKYPLNWSLLFKHEVLEKVGRAWIAKKIKEYMGVEEPSIVQHILKILGRAPQPEALRDKLLKEILDVKTEEFLFKLWQTLVFENMKIEEGLYATTTTAQ